jgi:hypothetical protein
LALVQQELLVLLEELVPPVQLVQLVRGLLECLVALDQPDILGQLDLLDLQVPKEFQVIPLILVLLDQQALLVRLALVQLVQLVAQVLLVQLDLLDILEQLVQLVAQDLLDLLDIQEQRDPLGLLEQRDLLEQLEQLELLDLLV